MIHPLLRAAVLTLSLQAAAIPTAVAQTKPTPAGPPFYTDSIGAGVALRYLWRGYDRGGLPLTADYAMSVFGGDIAERGQLLLNVDATSALADRSSTGNSDQLHGTLRLIAHVDDAGGKFWVGSGTYFLPSADPGKRTFTEAEVGITTRIPWPLPERRPLLIAEAAIDVTGDRGSFIRTALQFDYKFADRKSVFFTPGYNWSSYAADGVSRAEAFIGNAFSLDVSIPIQSDPAKSRNYSWSLEPFLQASWCRRNRDPNVGNVGVRVVVIR